MRFDEYVQIEKEKRIKRYQEDTEREHALELDSMNNKVSNLIQQVDTQIESTSKETSNDDVTLQKEPWGEYVFQNNKKKVDNER